MQGEKLMHRAPKVGHFHIRSYISEQVVDTPRDGRDSCKSNILSECSKHHERRNFFCLFSSSRFSFGGSHPTFRNNYTSFFVNNNSTYTIDLKKTQVINSPIDRRFAHLHTIRHSERASRRIGPSGSLRINLTLSSLFRILHSRKRNGERREGREIWHYS